MHYGRRVFVLEIEPRGKRLLENRIWMRVDLVLLLESPCLEFHQRPQSRNMSLRPKAGYHRTSPTNLILVDLCVPDALYSTIASLQSRGFRKSPNEKASSRTNEASGAIC